MLTANVTTLKVSWPAVRELVILIGYCYSKTSLFRCCLSRKSRSNKQNKIIIIARTATIQGLWTAAQYEMKGETVDQVINAR